MLTTRISLLLTAITMVHANSWNNKVWTRRTKRHHNRACPVTSDGYQGAVCPLAARMGTQVCLDDTQLCDGSWDCPDREDENPVMCLFYGAVRHEMYHMFRPTRSKQHNNVLPNLFSRISSLRDLLKSVEHLEYVVAGKHTGAPPCGHPEHVDDVTTAGVTVPWTSKTPVDNDATVSKETYVD